MAFKKINKNNFTLNDPETLFRDLRMRKVEGLLSQQADTLRAYMEHVDDSDIALELPTGSGKTLVGLLIAEWRRRKFNERCLFLCPTVQLVNQVAEQALEKYGIRTLNFAGSSKNYSEANKSSFQNCEAIGIATYSALFNSNSFFDNVGTIIFDDAHAAENYVASCWSLEISKFKNPECFNAIKELIEKDIEENDKIRFSNDNNDAIDRQFVNMYPLPYLYDKLSDFVSLLNEYCNSGEKYYRWNMIKNHLHACLLYYTSTSFLIRPIIPPTLTFAPYTNAKQRVYMSATLGEGGDLERIFGQSNIKRIPAPHGWDKQGIGRRYFVFPMRHWNEDEAVKKAIEWIKKFKRTLILTPRDIDSSKLESLIDNNEAFDKYTVFCAQDIEKSKKEFVEKDLSIALLANRYDGIDLPGDECRYLIIYGLPESTNLQERFLMSRLGSYTLFQVRIRTRITQAVGRCTRSSTDWSLVCIIGEKLNKYFMTPEKRDLFQPELQAEIEFGIEQSTFDNDKEEFSENIDIFISQNDEWNEANDSIIDIRTNKEQKEIADSFILNSVVTDEIKYVNNLWNSNFEEALSNAISVYSNITSEKLRGYRGLWIYLSGNAAYMQNKNDLAKKKYSEAAKAIKTLSWLQKFNERYEKSTEIYEEDLSTMIENIEIKLAKLGTINNTKLEKITDKIINGLNSNSAAEFEQAQVELGRLLGFKAHNSEEIGAPDPFWVIKSREGIVFEDYTDTGDNTTIIPKYKILQAKGHPDHIKYNHEEFKNINFKVIICSNVSQLDKAGYPHVENTYFLNKADFVSFAKKALKVIKILWENYAENDLSWKEFAFNKCKENDLTPNQIIQELTKKKLGDLI